MPAGTERQVQVRPHDDFAFPTWQLQERPSDSQLLAIIFRFREPFALSRHVALLY